MRQLSSIVAALVLLTPLAASDAYDGETGDGRDAVEQLRESITEEVYEQVFSEYASYLRESGLAESDVAGALQNLARSAADCALKNLSDYADQNSIELESLILSTGRTLTEIASNKEIFDLVDFETCIYTAYEKAGVPVS